MDFQQAHGHKGKTHWSLPSIVATSTQANRADQNNTILANEYLDSPQVLEEKMEMVAELLRKSKFTVAYTGAGLSKASGIPDYATKAENSVVKVVPQIQSSLDALPTKAHHALTQLERQNLLHAYVQQNHDGLPQKSGFPQEKINEIHGAWFDPSNPVVQFSGSLRTDLFESMLELEAKTDLCLCLGTSLSGMNADRMARTPAKKSLKRKALGTVIINLQQTPLDALCTVRIWAKLDDAFSILAKKLGTDLSPVIPPPLPSGDVFVVPYDEEGMLSSTGDVYSLLDLRTGAKVRIPVEGAMNENAMGEIRGKKEDGNYRVWLEEKKKDGKETKTVVRLLGWWWVEAALRGAIKQLPVINVEVKSATQAQFLQQQQQLQ
eukprot:TRINITY_DN930_c0_g1_i2.p1 TRINITY_DN930_c0_g1~~TRINITY_DN930_c0_g1_i2.p1  ORF type:complete len:378 (-),score=113.12 TRINITY_DN930_c0_g1_i2:277-1410(-)